MEFIDLNKQYKLHQKDIDEAIMNVVRSGKYIFGPQVFELEETIADFTGAAHVLGTGSGTDALLVALMALNLKPGDEVICPAFTFFATASMAYLLGGKPVFVDVDPIHGLIEPEAVEKAITDKTAGIITVDLFGQAADYETLGQVADRHNLWIIEDGAQSFGGSRNGTKTCNFGTVATTSFYPPKPLGCMGEGGMLFTNDDKLAASMKAILHQGQVGTYNHEYLGINARMDTIQAAILLAKMNFFDEEIQLRQKVASRYFDLLGNIKGIAVPEVMEGNISAWAQFTLKCDKRDELAKHLNDNGIPTAVHYPKTLNKQPILKQAGFGELNLPVSEKLAETVLSIPMHPYLEEDDQKLIAEAIGEFAADNF